MVSLAAWSQNCAWVTTGELETLLVTRTFWPSYSEGGTQHRRWTDFSEQHWVYLSRLTRLRGCIREWVGFIEKVFGGPNRWTEIGETSPCYLVGLKTDQLNAWSWNWHQRVWRYCISMADYDRPILASEEKFFDECNTGNGRLLYCHSHGHNFDMIDVKYLLLLCWQRQMH